ncbi:VCBS repeat-containing protein [Streptomyces sp. NPDC051207]|uniref:FG-GAP repeat domain-containing protein n=1 Tax=Streptomyces sp. NPDC051207 TaxID=3154641 RepID=UPI0034462070
MTPTETGAAYNPGGPRAVHVTMSGHMRSRNGGRRLRRGAALPVVALVLLAGCGDDGDPPPAPDGPPKVAACVGADGALVADVDGDGRADRVLDPSGTGRRLAVAFGGRSGSGHPVPVRELAGDGAEDAKDVVGAVADFDRDGWPDLVVAATGEWRGDDPVEPDVAEVRFGPFSASGGGQRTRGLDLGETRGLAVADYDHDRHPDLAVYAYAGDGVHEVQARLGNVGTGLGDADERSRRYTVLPERFDESTPSGMPRDALSAFHPRCRDSG